jgi:aspartyl protease family protein
MMTYRFTAVCIGCVALLLSAALRAADIELVGILGQKAVVVVDGERHVLGLGDKTPQGATLVAVHASSVVLSIDGTPKTLELGQSGGLATTFAAPQESEVRLMPDTMGMYFANGSVNGRSMRFLVDTGATTIALSGADARRLGIDYRREGRPIPIHTASGRARGYALRLDRVKVGDIELFGVEAAVIDGGGPDTALLGMSFLNRVEMVRDGRLLTLRKK